MKRLAWLTDIHVNFVSPQEFAQLATRINECGADAILIGGDIAEASTFANAIRLLASELGVPLYFVLGNHDYYHGSIAGVRNDAASLSEESAFVQWLPTSGVVQLTAQTTLVGHGGWGDGRNGQFLASGVLLNDYLLIEDFSSLYDDEGADQILTPDKVLTQQLLRALHSLGDEAATHFRRVLPDALQSSEHTIVLTHVPPFHEACWHEGQLSDANWSPHFTCQAVGDVLRDIMSEHPDRRMTVLCGHTHSSGHARILDNLEVVTGGAVYGEPGIQQIIEVE